MIIFLMVMLLASCAASPQPPQPPQPINYIEAPEQPKPEVKARHIEVPVPADKLNSIDKDLQHMQQLLDARGQSH